VKVLFDGKIPLKVFLFQGNLISLLLFGWNIGLLIALMKSRSNYLKIDEEAITYTKGLISQEEERIELYRIRDTGYKQGIIERIVGIGTLKITSDDDSSPVIEIPIITPKKMAEELRPLIKKDRKNMRTMNID